MLLVAELTPAEAGECCDYNAAEEDQQPGHQQDVSEHNDLTRSENSTSPYMMNMKAAVATLPPTLPT